jgi:N-acyl-D-amino-acid deacylase
MEETGAKNVDKFLQRIDEEGFPVNHGLLIGARDLREQVDLVDIYTPLPDDKVFRMVQLAEAALDQGAFGISFGLVYVPGTSEKELQELFKAAARRGVIVAVHPRYFAMGLPGIAPDAVAGEEEIIKAARETGAKLQISHVGSQIAWKSKPYDGLLKRGLKKIEEARDEGLDVTGDCHPYDAWCTYVSAAMLDSLLFPAHKELYGVGLESVEVGNGPFKGKKLNEDLFMRLRKESPTTLVVGHMMKEDLVARTLMNPYIMVASDAVYETATQTPTHPRGSGAFPRMLRRMVRELGIFSLQGALYKMTIQPALAIRLSQKGKIAVGADADFAIFDLDAIEDLATYTEPDRGVKGMIYVIVGGIPVVEKGELKNVMPGKAVRYQG